MIPEKPTPTKNHYGIATFIVGCLVQQEMLAVGKDSRDFYEYIEVSVRLVAAVLYYMEISDGDLPPLPFIW